MEAFSALLAFCEGNSSVNGAFPSQRVSNEEIWFFLLAWKKNVTGRYNETP